MKKPNKQRVLEIAEHHDFHVHIYSWSAANMRKLTRRMLKDGELVCVLTTRTHRHYRTPK